MTTQVAQYDFRLSAADIVRADLDDTLRELCSKYVFQLERGDSGYEHYQGRISLRKKRRPAEIKNFWRKAYQDGTLKVDLPNYIEPTSNPAAGDQFYVTKLDTRLDGPWSDRDIQRVFTRQLREFLEQEMYPWQEKVYAMCEVWEPRVVNVIYDTHGNLGKSVFAEYLEFEGKALSIPPFRQMEDIMACVIDQPVHKAYLVDMPRGMKKDKLGEFYSGIEELKNGVAYDKRYSFRKKRFDRPQIFVFTNQMPALKLLSRDRWRIMRVTADKDLQTMQADEYSDDNDDEAMNE